MLKPEQAQARLAEWRLPKEEARLAAAVKNLPARVRTPVQIVCGWEEEDPRRQFDWRAQRRRQREAAIQFDRVTAKDRASFFKLVSPHIAATLETVWQLLKASPYQAGYVTKAFRAPSHPDATAEQRAAWLSRVASVANGYPAEILSHEWLAAWAPHLGSEVLAAEIGVLLAGVLSKSSAESDAVFEILRQSLSNQHEIGAVGRHIFTALLLADRVEGWELVEKTLLAAQRQEGLRQAILETVDMTHPEAFRRMLRLILDHDLIRFSATVRAADVWFGQLWAAASAGVVKKMLAQVIEYLEHPPARKKALSGKDPQAAFLALWCMATEDAVASVAPAQKLLKAKTVELRYAAARHLANLDLDAAASALVEALDDEDLRVALLGVRQEQYNTEFEPLPERVVDQRFEKIERLLERVPTKPQKLEPLVWPWTEIQVKQSQVACALLTTRGDRPAARLIPHLTKLDAYPRRIAAEQVLAEKPWSDATRQAVFDLAGSTSSDLRQFALPALLEETLRTGEAERLEVYLKRKTGDLRHGVLSVLLKQADADALASAARLLDAKDAQQRLAGLELLRLLSDAQRSVAECRLQADAYREDRKKLSRNELAHLDEIAKEKVAVATLDDALGLMDPAERSPVVAPRNLKTPFITAAAVDCLKSLDALIHEHRETTVQYKTYSGMEEELLGNVRWGFPRPELDKPREGQAAKLPLSELWLEWFAKRNKKLRDADGMELVRALIALNFRYNSLARNWQAWSEKDAARKKVAKSFSGGQPALDLQYSHLVSGLTYWLLFLNPIDARNYLLDAAETAYSLVPQADMQRLTALAAQPSRQPRGYRTNDEDDDWRDQVGFGMWTGALQVNQSLCGFPPNAEQSVRLWRLLHWHDEPFSGAPRKRPEADLMFAAYEQGAATLADLADHLLGPRGMGHYYPEGFDLLAALTSRKRSKEHEAFLARRPEVQELIDQAVERILELELSRGDAPTAATTPANSIRALYGADTLRRILQALGKAAFKSGSRWGGQAKTDRRETLTHLAQTTYPAADEQPGEFVKLMRAAVKAGEFPEERLLQFAFLAPQWTRFIQAYFDWRHFDEGVYWFLAHMQYVGGATENAALASGAEESVEEETESEADSIAPKPRKLSAWERLILERTPLSEDERNAGAIDVHWFRRTHELLGPKRWLALAQAARFAATPAQAKRAQFIGDVLLNKVKRQELVSGIKKKQLKEHVRLLGLLPLAAGKKRAADLHERCEILREYRRYANSLSGLTKPDALRAWEIGLKNLAQTAGFADPLRLEWAVGAEAVADLAKGPVRVTKNGVTVALSLDEQVRPALAIHNGQKELKAIPPAVKKDKQVAELTARATDLRRQASSIRQSLETAMCRGDAFSGEELRDWCGHALLAPLLTRLVVVGEGIMGYPDKAGKALRDHRGKLEPVKPKETLRLAHPHDLLASEAWHAWQRECFQAERMQPFKQIFRELYVLAKQEKKDGAVSHRYDGQQVQPKQALALFGGRGWNTGEGVFKVFHDDGLTVDVHFDSGVTTPAEVEGWALAGVTFRRRDEWEPIPLSAVPPRLFSEVMRDVDLVVSVAHAGGVDPEASASTVEMRSGLVRETCSLLGLKNVRLKNSHAVVDGELGAYSVHLGSGVVHRMPGGAVCIVPVHAQHRGRLFLPFADDDPRTAEVVSKVLLLARDHEIQDPTILEQLRC